MTIANEQDVNPSLWRVGALQNIFETANLFGCDLVKEYAAFGLTPNLVDQGEALFKLKDIAEILSIAAQKTGRADFALKLAENQDLSNASSLVILLKTAPNLRDSFKSALEYNHIYIQGLSWMLDESQDSERLSFSANFHGLTPTQHNICAEFILAQTYQFIFEITGDRPPLERVHFAGAAQGDSKILSQYFRAPVDFDAEVFGLEFARGTLDKSLVYANRDLHDNIRGFLCGSGEKAEASLEQSVRAVIRSLLPTQDLNIDRVAQSFGCCERTLQRRLKKECGVTYHDLVSEVRFTLARQFLSQSNMTVTNLSLAVGYSSPTNFTRAFKQAMGCSPRDWRNHNHVHERTGSFL